MNDAHTLDATPMPVRALLTDDPAELLDFALALFQQGDVAIATLVNIQGGTFRALGSHVVISSDGRYAGSVSGGCVEAAIAAEALLAMVEKRDRNVMFGLGSPVFDIVLPCGGGMNVSPR